MSKVTLEQLGLGADDLAAIGKLSEKGMNPDQIADAIYKAHSISSTDIINESTANTIRNTYPFISDTSINEASATKYKNIIFGIKDILLEGSVDNTKTYWLASFSRNNTSTNYRIDIHDSDNKKVCGGNSAFVVTENTGGITTVVVPQYNNSGITCTLMIDYSKIENGIVYYGTVDLTPERFSFSPLATMKYKGDISKNTVVFDFTANDFKVYSKYGKDSDIRFDFNKFTDNQLFALHQIYKVSNTSKFISTFTSGTTINNQDTDWIGPYYVTAVSNGDAGTKKRTGGAHPDGTTPTAITDSIELYIDGVRKGTTGTAKGDKVDIFVINRVMAYNTLTRVGDLRYVLKEKIHYQIEGSKITVKVDILPLENIIIEDYYGHQAPQSYYNYIHYLGGQYASPVASLNTNTDSGNKSSYVCNTAILSKTSSTETMTFSTDLTVGLGNRDYLPTTRPMIISKDFEKTYSWLIYGNTTPFALGQIVSWVGSYEFRK